MSRIKRNSGFADSPSVCSKYSVNDECMICGVNVKLTKPRISYFRLSTATPKTSPERLSIKSRIAILVKCSQSDLLGDIVCQSCENKIKKSESYFTILTDISTCVKNRIPDDPCCTPSPPKCIKRELSAVIHRHTKENVPPSCSRQLLPVSSQSS